MQELINSLFDTGMYNQLLKAGLISYKLAAYRDYYLYVDAQIKTRSISKTAATKEAAAVYKVDERTIRRAIILLQSQ